MCFDLSLVSDHAVGTIWVLGFRFEKVRVPFYSVLRGPFYSVLLILVSDFLDAESGMFEKIWCTIYINDAPFWPSPNFWISSA